jgi:hypothetical protein
MKLKVISLSFIISGIICLTGCADKARIEKNYFKSQKTASTLNLFSPNGKINIHGWEKDFIEIDATKRTYSLFPEQNLIKFQAEEIDNNFNLNVSTADSLVNAEIILDIKVPFILQGLNISTENAECNINDTFGNVNITGKNSIINGDFKNTTVKINLINGVINATFDLTLSTDVIMSNEQGETNINIIKTGDKSFICANTFSGNINLVLSSSIPYLLVSSASVPHVLEFLTSTPKIFEDNDYRLFINNTSNSTPELQIFLDNESGKTRINNAFFIDIN